MLHKPTLAETMRYTNWGGKGFPKYEGQMARQYFSSTVSDSLIVSGTTGSITAETAFLTAAQCEQAFPVPVGVGNQPYAGQLFRFELGGIMTTGTAGTLLITPRYGTTTGGTTMGASAAQTYVASLTNVPWHMEGMLVFRTVSLVATTSTAWLTGRFVSQGTLATAGGGMTIVFGSTAAISIDTLGPVGAASGALCFTATFSVASTITTQWTSFHSLN